MELLYFFEKLRMPWLDKFMLIITQLGEETAFLIIALVLFWCVDKYKGYYLLAVGFLGTLANQFLKLWFRIPRPWLLDENFTIVEQARSASSGYSFPSGHTQCAVGIFGSIAYLTKRRWICVSAICIAFLVAVSRMYLGVHTLLDVSVSVAIAVMLILLLKAIVFGQNKWGLPVLLSIMLGCAVLFLLFVEAYNFPANIDQHNLVSGVKNAYTLFGSMCGMTIVYIVDEKWLRFPTKAVLWAQIIKVGAGLLIVLAVKSGFKDILNNLLGEEIGRAVRYCLIVVFAGVLWPLSFRWFSRLGDKE